MRSVFDPFSMHKPDEQKFGLNLLGVFFLAHHYGGTVRASNASGRGVFYSLEIPVTSTPPVNPEVSSEEFVTKVLVNDALWEKLLSGI
jgi:K+-sensing histidine kinase KdpD